MADSLLDRHWVPAMALLCLKITGPRLAAGPVRTARGVGDSGGNALRLSSPVT
jgi:hypothetical protein